jgi:hypothetical protein
MATAHILAMAKSGLVCYPNPALAQDILDSSGVADLVLNVTLTLLGGRQVVAKELGPPDVRPV